jgi:hypothetical protein
VDVLGDRIIGGHAKDIVIEDRLALHLTECSAGTGLLDYDTLLRRVEALDPEHPLVAEHCTTDDLPGISRFLHAKAAELGIAVLD